MENQSTCAARKQILQGNKQEKRQKKTPIMMGENIMGTRYTWTAQMQES